MQFISKTTFAMHALPEISDEKTDKINSFSIDTGFLYGELGEYVYNQSQKLSELVWDLKPLYYAGGAMDVHFFGRFFICSGYWSGVNKRAGEIEDTDWDPSGAISRVSVHDCLLIQARFFDLNAGYSIALESGHKIDHKIFFLLGYKYQQIIVEAQNGYVESPSDIRINVAGVFIQYEQVYKIPYIGIDWRTVFMQRLKIDVFCMYSPFVLCSATDYHVSSKMEYHDSFKGGTYISAGLLIGWIMNSAYSISISSTYSTVLEFKGDTYSVDVTTGSASDVYKNGAGANFEALEMKLGFSILFN